MRVDFNNIKNYIAREKREIKQQKEANHLSSEKRK
jgi:hypothetical protein